MRERFWYKGTKPKEVIVQDDFETYMEDKSFKEINVGDLFQIRFLMKDESELYLPFTIIGKNFNNFERDQQNNCMDIMSIVNTRGLFKNLEEIDESVSKRIMPRTIWTKAEYGYVSEEKRVWLPSLHELGIVEDHPKDPGADYTTDHRKERKYPYFKDPQNYYPYIWIDDCTYTRKVNHNKYMTRSHNIVTGKPYI